MASQPGRTHTRYHPQLPADSAWESVGEGQQQNNSSQNQTLIIHHRQINHRYISQPFLSTHGPGGADSGAGAPRMTDTGRGNSGQLMM